MEYSWSIEVFDERILCVVKCLAFYVRAMIKLRSKDTLLKKGKKSITFV
jgi:hypothetical protein